MSHSLLGILGAAFLFGFAVLVHELGHFLMAKWVGVGVKKFAIGFGPRIFAFTRGGTEYSIRWIPVGGFVALKGMIEGLGDEEESKDGKEDAGGPQPSEGAIEAAKKLKGSAQAETSKITEDLDALRNKPALARIAVFAAGVCCNYLTAILFTGLWLWYGVPKAIDLSNVLEDIPASSQLYELGWRSGDKIVGAEGKTIKDWEDVDKAIGAAAERIDGKKVVRSKSKAALSTATVTFTVRRGPQTMRHLKFPLGIPEKEWEFFRPPRPARIGAIMPNSPADRARLTRDNYTLGEVIRPIPTWEQMKPSPLQPRDTVVAINDRPVKTWHDMEKILQANPDNAVNIVVERGKDQARRLLRLAVVLERSDEDSRKGRLGVFADDQDGDKRERMSFREAFTKAPMRTFDYTYAIIMVQIEFIAKSSWRETQRNMGGPVAIAIIAYKSAQKGLGDYLQLFVAISIILAFMNVLPIPVLDGGYIAITLVETIIRRPIPQKVLVPILTVFMFLFIMLIALLFYNDIKNWVLKF